VVGVGAVQDIPCRAEPKQRIVAEVQHGNGEHSSG
jgi:hypothetical protein